MKLSQRLSNIYAMLPDSIDHLWDTCCDHGYLGAHALAQGKAKHVHFVDFNEPIIHHLTQQLQVHFPDAPWQCHVEDVTKLALTNYTGSRVVVIAGVGGDLVAQAIRALPVSELIICPVHHTYKVRQALLACHYKLRREQLVVENNRFYEILHVSQHGSELSAVGTDIWQHKDAWQYQQKLINHYRHKPEHSNILQAYEQVQVAVKQAHQ